MELSSQSAKMAACRRFSNLPVRLCRIAAIEIWYFCVLMTIEARQAKFVLL